MISRKLIIVSFGLIVLALHPYSEAQQAVKISLDGTWNFKTDPNNIGEEQGWFKMDLDGSSWDKMDVPGNWNLRNEYAHYTGKGWYKKSFMLPQGMKRKNIILHFEAVYHDCTVWFNGEKVGTNHSGFLPFEFDVTELIHADKENTITLCADNTFKRGAIWNYGGIRRPVTLSAHDGLRIRHQYITPEIDLDKKLALVNIKVLLENFSATQKKVEGNVLLSANNGYEETLPFSVTIPASGKSEVMVKTTIRRKDFYLWDFDDPFLYRSEVNLDQMRKESGKV